MELNVNEYNALKCWLESGRKATIKEIAEKFGVTTRTVDRWKKKAQWDLIKGDRITKKAYSTMLKQKSEVKKMTKEELNDRYTEVAIVEQVKIANKVEEVSGRIGEVIVDGKKKTFSELYLSKPTTEQQDLLNIIELTDDINEYTLGLQETKFREAYFIKEFQKVMSGEDMVSDEEINEIMKETSQYRLERDISTIKLISKRKALMEISGQIMKVREHKAKLMIHIDILKGEKNRLKNQVTKKTDALSQAISNSLLERQLSRREKGGIIETEVVNVR